MIDPFQPRRPPEVEERYLGVSDTGRHMSTYRDHTPLCQHHHGPPPRPERPWGKYAAAAAVGGPIAVFAMLGMAIFAIAVAISAVACTACLLVLRSMFRDYQKGRAK